MSTSPISKLNDDYLLFIFLNIPWRIYERTVDNDTRRPLNDIRAVSQVCHRWRELLLSTPMIWGRVVDLDVEEYGPKRIKWMDEVVRRAGSSPLWISGWVVKRIPDFRFDSHTFFLRLLQKWERIEKLSVVIYSRAIAAIHGHFLLRAPILKMFDVQFNDSVGPLFLDTLQHWSSERLFADYAPQLRVIRANNMAFNPNSPWLSGIRQMVPIPTMLGMRDIFDLLQHTPNLESVSVFGPHHSSRVELDPPANKPTLPNLSSIDLRTTFSVSARILDYITPRQLSFLRLQTKDEHLVDKYVIPSFQKNLPLYIASHLASNPLTGVQFHLTPDLFVLTQLRYRYVHSPGGLPRDLKIIMRNSYSDTDRDSFMACTSGILLQASELYVKQPLFESVHWMILDLSLPSSSDRFPALHATLSLFHNVELLILGQHHCHTLNRVVSCHDEPNRVLFPKLNTLLVGVVIPDGRPLDWLPGVTEFLLLRKKTGHPIARLVLPICHGSHDATKHLRALEEIEGLELVWYNLEGNTEVSYSRA